MQNQKNLGQIRILLFAWVVRSSNEQAQSTAVSSSSPLRLGSARAIVPEPADETTSNEVGARTLQGPRHYGASSDMTGFQSGSEGVSGLFPKRIPGSKAIPTSETCEYVPVLMRNISAI